ncbi:hypothetical protein [Fodinibius saliphilus]|uniref:hypothetical protein n=1 Tax=Fodinibius saliphilus TaxID=1920650 RepID=UPI0011083736|nr:hypothetical protein [Fodinibius saliphilus]
MLRWRNVLVVLFLCLYSLMGAKLAFGQTWNLPDNRKNTRFTSDQFDIPRPALSMRGFDNTKNDSYQHHYSSTTFGVKQVLEKAYGIEQARDLTVTKPFRKIIGLHDDGLKVFTTANAEYNSAVLESMAFVALMTLIIEENDGDNGEPNIFTSSLKDLFVNMPSHSEVLIDFITALHNRGNYVRDVSKGNAFKRSNSLMKVARAWDLYLALENAYEDLGGNLGLLLNQSDKQWWNDYIYSELKILWQDSNGNLPTIWDDPYSAGVQMHEIQAGNWPLISFVATGYVALGFNGPFTPIIDDDDMEFHDLDSIFDRAMKSTAFHYTDSGDKRYNYWWYQTDGGKPFWAEGSYYFDIALRRVIPFWHVVRANNLLNDPPHGDGIDPFRYSKFLAPLKWHANIATPDGNTPPIDDGNKNAMKSSMLLSWSSAYGDPVVGKKFAYIRDLPELKGPGSKRNSRLVEIAIPRTSVGEGTAPPNTYGNTSPGSLYHQQLVTRRRDSEGKLHYLFLNGESGEQFIEELKMQLIK